MILRTFVEKCRELHLCAYVGQIRQGAMIRGGGQPNSVNASILGAYLSPKPSLIAFSKNLKMIKISAPSLWMLGNYTF